MGDHRLRCIICHLQRFKMIPYRFRGNIHMAEHRNVVLNCRIIEIEVLGHDLRIPTDCACHRFTVTLVKMDWVTTLYDAAEKRRLDRPAAADDCMLLPLIEGGADILHYISCCVPVFITEIFYFYPADTCRCIRCKSPDGIFCVQLPDCIFHCAVAACRLHDRDHLVEVAQCEQHDHRNKHRCFPIHDEDDQGQD